MKVKPIIGIISPFWLIEENIKHFESAYCLVKIIRNLDDLESIDALVFPSIFCTVLEKYLWKEFIKEIVEIIECKEMPIWIMWQSIELFYKHLHLKKLHIIKEYSSNVQFDFLDEKPFSTMIFNTYSFKERRLWFNFFLYNLEELAFLPSWECITFKREKLLITLFSPEFSWDKRIYEYFVNWIIQI